MRMVTGLLLWNLPVWSYLAWLQALNGTAEWSDILWVAASLVPAIVFWSLLDHVNAARTKNNSEA